VNISSDARSSRHSFHEDRHCISWLEKDFSESNIQPRFLRSVEKNFAQRLGG